MKKRWAIVGTIVAAGIIGNFLPEEEPVTKEEPKTEEVVKKEPVKKEEPAPVKKEEPKKDDSKAQEFLEDKHLEILQNSYDGMSSVKFNREEKMFVVTPTNEDLIMAITMVMSGNPGLQQNWDELVGSFVDMSATMKENLGDGYSISMSNPVNTDNIILIVMNGTVIYDAVNNVGGM